VSDLDIHVISYCAGPVLVMLNAPGSYVVESRDTQRHAIGPSTDLCATHDLGYESLLAYAYRLVSLERVASNMDNALS